MIYNFERAKENTKDVEGWLGESDAINLYLYASKANNNGCLVEIGSWGGKSLTYTTYATLENNSPCNIYSIDPFLTSKDESNDMYESFVKNLKKNKIFDKVKHLKEKSQTVGQSWNEPISFIFIDGFHKYDWVKKDFELFFPHVLNNGYVAFHDIGTYAGPTLLVEEIVEKYDNFKIIGIFGITLIAQKVENLQKEDKEHNVQIIKALHDSVDYEKLVY